jgi:hypothetical protein
MSPNQVLHDHHRKHSEKLKIPMKAMLDPKTGSSELDCRCEN